MTKEKANKIYDVLSSLGKAPESMRDSFIHHHTKTSPICDEWRFQGVLGFGGKYYSRDNRISYYPEHKTPELEELMKTINIKLKEI